MASGVIDTVAEPQPDSAGAANSNHVAGREPEPERPVRRSYVREGGAMAWTSPFVQPAPSADEDTEAPLLPEEALRPAPSLTKRRARSSALLKGWVLLMCLILGAAGLVALRGERPRAAVATGAGPGQQAHRDPPLSALVEKTPEPAVQAPVSGAVAGAATPVRSGELPASAPKSAAKLEKPATAAKPRAELKAAPELQVVAEKPVAPAEGQVPPAVEAAGLVEPKEAPSSEPASATSAGGVPDNPYDTPDPAAE